jgi:hypothetical protein
LRPGRQRRKKLQTSAVNSSLVLAMIGDYRVDPPA